MNLRSTNLDLFRISVHFLIFLHSIGFTLKITLPSSSPTSIFSSSVSHPTTLCFITFSIFIILLSHMICILNGIRLLGQGIKDNDYWSSFVI
ncbi:hypothetical protein F5884DRAFT_810647 [Xylogone sp. PMI_703]|nr:hypothetical protein F5884DRAFT_810647 [Xylogone sp. PMI_703]